MPLVSKRCPICEKDLVVEENDANHQTWVHINKEHPEVKEKIQEAIGQVADHIDSVDYIRRTIREKYGYNLPKVGRTL